MPRRKRAAERSTRRKGTGRHVAVARERGRLLDGHCAAARGTPCGPGEQSGVQLATGRGARSRALTSERSDVVSRSGAAYATGVPNGWRDRCLDDPPRPPHATAREYAFKGCYRKHCGIRRPARQGADCPSQLSSSTGSPTAWRGRGTGVLWRRPPRQPSILQSSLRVVQRSPAGNRGETGECLVSTRSLMLCMAASWFLAVCLEAPPGSGHAELRSDASARGRPAPDGPPAVVCDLGQAVLGKTDH